MCIRDSTYPDTSDVKSFMYAPAEKLRKYLSEGEASTNEKTKPVISCEYMPVSYTHLDVYKRQAQ